MYDNSEGAKGPGDTRLEEVVITDKKKAKR